MLTRDYGWRLENLKQRRFSDELNKAILTESFSKTTFGNSVKYALESMQPIDESYTANTFIASNNVQGNLDKGLKAKNILVEYRHQGSSMMNTSIKLHSDIDLVAIIKKYETIEAPQIPITPYKGNPLDDLKELRSESFNILNGIYKKVDNSNAKAIKVYPTNPNRMVDVVISNWFNSNDYALKNRGEEYRGIQILDTKEDLRKTCFPFLHIERVNSKGNSVNQGLPKLIRLLKSLKADTTTDIYLSSFEITSLLYDMSDFSLSKSNNQQLLLLPEASVQLGKLISDNHYRRTLLSPNGKEYVFGDNTSKVEELKKMKTEIDTLIIDITSELPVNLNGFDQEIIYS